MIGHSMSIMWEWVCWVSTGYLKEFNFATIQGQINGTILKPLTRDQILSKIIFPNLTITFYFSFQTSGSNFYCWQSYTISYKISVKVEWCNFASVKGKAVAWFAWHFCKIFGDVRNFHRCTVLLCKMNKSSPLDLV